MPLPAFKGPIPVRFVTDYVKVLQESSIGGKLGEATDRLITNVLARAQIEDTVESYVKQVNGEPDEEEGMEGDALLDTLDNVVDGIMKGESLQAHQKEIRQYIHGQQDRSELITNLLLTKDYRRLTTFLRLRDSLEKRLVKAAERDDLSPTEVMALAGLVGGITDKLESRVQAGSSNINDVFALLNKADFALQLHEETVKAKFANTTSTGREIVRRVMHKLQKIDKKGGK